MTAIEFSTQLIGLEQSLFKYAYRLTMKKPDAKDLVQDTFLRVLLKRDKYVDNQKLKAWTFKVLRNTFIDNYRQNYKQDKLRDPINELLFINQTEPAVCDDPHSVLSADEINSSIDQLKEKLRVPLKMYINGYKYTEIAEKLDLKIGTVKNRIFLSRKQLTQQLNS